MLARLFSIAFWGFVGLSTLLIFPVALVLWLLTAPFDRRRAASHAFTCLWASLYTWLNPFWRVRVVGREHLPRGRAAVLVANHSSAVDIFVLYRLLTHFKWVSKSENFRIPCIGWNMQLCRYIPLRRGDRASVVEMLAACERALGEGSSVLLFPEGTRSDTGELRPFKPGAFEIAKRAGAPIVPIVVEGTRLALPKHGFTVRRADMRLRVLPAIMPEAQAATAEAMAAETRAMFERALAAGG